MYRLISLSTALMSFVLIATPSLAQPADQPGWYMHPYWGWGQMFGGGIMMILIWGAIIFLLFVLARALNATHHGLHAQPHHTALEILKVRFAKGEIDKDEFEERRKLLER
jgi:putative membrane protein